MKKLNRVMLMLPVIAALIACVFISEAYNEIARSRWLQKQESINLELDTLIRIHKGLDDLKYIITVIDEEYMIYAALYTPEGELLTVRDSTTQPENPFNAPDVPGYWERARVTDGYRETVKYRPDNDMALYSRIVECGGETYIAAVGTTQQALGDPIAGWLVPGALLLTSCCMVTQVYVIWRVRYETKGRSERAGVRRTGHVRNDSAGAESEE